MRHKGRLLTGFTLIEILIVVGIITVLATAVVVAVNPAKRLQTAKDQQREIHLQTILSAIEQKRTLEGGWFGCDALPSATTTPADEQEVPEGELLPDWKTIGVSQDPGYYDLFSCLAPKYLAEPLFDPDGGSATDTHYQIWQNPQTKYVSLRYVREDPYKLITAGPDTYRVATAPRSVTTKDITNIG